MSNRPGATHNLRVVVDTAPVPPARATRRSGITLTMIDRLTAHDLRIDGICYDGAFRGTSALVSPHTGTATSATNWSTLAPQATPLDSPTASVTPRPRGRVEKGLSKTPSLLIRFAAPERI
ncbi:hypothetical protein [Mycobacteroides abscessus]|uniref:hypothetical protein n=1 Tax=Mycobacteroides abscessus TaxID=36809 RepID=UPI0009D29B10|nr:hypothetical protein [Mycobacteroides abscessus]MBN7323479.1 hypothetical protein [Mycobacteroides abscessus subsp. massiliense]MBN7498003.1 hypothetical protein [Mycobacteroides abscessus subsp. abscessus]MDB2197616.1 hypothetical protein [Mycobacteroides abscessus subsp. abscessus]MDB2202008.1 hypothetical protein [Mycobacteroides abscessus subsp. abscessus]MDO3030172.1 hypothetical protein [Mycobacteroides abscessus subsp. massiliense]